MLLYYAIATLHVIVCVILVLVVLLQSGRGADLAGAFGGGATQTAFGSRGPASFLSKMTTIAAIVFMLTSIGLSLISTKTEAKSVLETNQTECTSKESACPDQRSCGNTHTGTDQSKGGRAGKTKGGGQSRRRLCPTAA